MNRYIKVRDHVEDDIAFIYDAYMRNNWYLKENSTTLKKATWMGLQRKRLDKILETQKVQVACLSQDEDIIVGFGFKDGEEKDFVYVKLAWRNSPQKIEELLLNKLKEQQ